jgi:2-polyprenyl-3-methyl-5-hydroxy-6-metoxy-1,4-benzoquinol methylase
MLPLKSEVLIDHRHLGLPALFIDCGMTSTEGLIYDPFSDEWRLASDTDVNYFASATRR